ncbi:histidinol-phosphatase [Brevundimonas sp. LM2]|uniref:CehA/McbA family metallohydrolase n=1 Tax=Brevundimonas sp. LM2 TaxID=1938605 RepID=UPI000983DDE0|nr:CehA/McbA family metallohydrolase [Brevundimonas sp. LM2]AQR60408.1 histidinol-phosphatase [Brevundimonas sp. LM2]
MKTPLLALGLALSLASRSVAAQSVPQASDRGTPPTGTWLSGDLHVHSRHSTESTNNPIRKILAVARANNMGFLLISDHDNHQAGDVAGHTWADPEFVADDIVLLYGAEWTTNRGHANIMAAQPYDHQALYDVRDARDWDIKTIKDALGVHLSANHPTGKDHFGFSFDLADSLEVWNSVLWPRNEASLLVWDDMLRSGRRLPGRGGSDSHHGLPQGDEVATPQSTEATANSVGTPTTWVFAADRTGEAVIAALESGRVSISANPASPRVELTADLDADGTPDLMMGDNVVASGQPVRFEVRLNGDREAGLYRIRIIRDGGELSVIDLDGAVTDRVSFTDAPVTGARTYYRVEVRGPQTPFPSLVNWQRVAGDMVALSNPIYFNFDPDF